MSQHQQDEKERIAQQREDETAWRAMANSTKTAELMFSDQYPRFATGIQGGGRDRAGCMNLPANTAEAAAATAADGRARVASIERDRARESCRIACQSHVDCRYFWLPPRSSSDDAGHKECCLKTGAAGLDGSKGMITNLPRGEFYRMVPA